MFLNYINNFRGIAIVHIVAGHCVSAFNWDGADPLYKFLKIFFADGTILFVFIGGYLFQHLSGRYEFRAYLTKKFLYVLLPYLIWSVPAIIYFTVFVQRFDVPANLYDQSVFFKIFYFYITGRHLAPYWFMPMITIYYLISYGLYYSDKNNFLYFFLPVYIVISLLVPRGGVTDNFFHFFSVYVLGMFFSRYKEMTNTIITKKYIIIINLIIVILLTCFQYYDFFKASYIEKLFLSVLTLSIMIKFNNFFKNYLNLLATTSFSVYFTHSYIISGIKWIALNKTGQYLNPGLLIYLFFSCIIIAVCVMLTVGFKKILKGKSRYIIGS